MPIALGSVVKFKSGSHAMVVTGIMDTTEDSKNCVLDWIDPGDSEHHMIEDIPIEALIEVADDAAMRSTWDDAAARFVEARTKK